MRVDDDGLGHSGPAVLFIHIQVGVGSAEGIGKYRLVPLHSPADRLRVWIGQQLFGIEAVAACGFPWSMDTIAVPLSGMYAGNKSMPDKGGALFECQRLCLIILVIEEAEFHAVAFSE